MSENIQHNIDISAVPISKETGDALIKPIASSIGNASGTVLDGLFHLILDPIRKFNIQRNFALEQFEKEVKGSVSEIPREFLDESKIGIVLKAMEDSRYQLNEEYIRELFTKLITSTLDSRNNSSITPKFSSIISEMSVKEAILLKDIYYNSLSGIPLVSFQVQNDETLFVKFLEPKYLILDNQIMTAPLLELSLLESANLIYKQNEQSLKYLFKDYSNYYKRLDELFPNNYREIYPDSDENERVYHETSYYELTELGKSFCKIVF